MGYIYVRISFILLIFRGNQSALTINVNSGEILSLDSSKYDQSLFITSGASDDPSIKLWDLRRTNQPVQNFTGHQFGIRKVVFSPHNGNNFISTG